MKRGIAAVLRDARHGHRGDIIPIASDLGNPSDVTVGTGHGWRKGTLFVCGFDGTVREFVRT